MDAGHFYVAFLHNRAVSLRISRRVQLPRRDADDRR